MKRVSGLLSLSGKILDWMKLRMDERPFLYALAIASGVASAAAAVILKRSLHFTEHLARTASAALGSPWLLAVFPLLGIGLTIVWTRFVVRKDISHGVSRVLEAVSRDGGKMESHNAYSSVVACTLTSGMGGSVGMEAPILTTGAALGANIAEAAGLAYRDRVLLMGCGVAGAMGGIFKAPITGLVFCLEVLALDAAASSLIPLLLSSMTAYLISAFASSGSLVEFEFAVHQGFSLANVPWYLGLGLICSLLSIWFMRGLRLTEGLVKRMGPLPLRWLAGSAVLGLLIFLFPAFYGDGFLGMESMLGGADSKLLASSLASRIVPEGTDWALPVFLLALAFIKPVATALTTGSGGVGGVFAPGLFCGAAAGIAYSRAAGLLGLKDLPEGNFALAGMAGIISGIMHAPLTGIFLIAEISAGYELLVPLTLVAAVSYMVVRRFEPFSVYTRPLARSGRLITHNKDAAALTLMKLADYVQAYPLSLRPETTVAELSRIMADSGLDSFPVTDGEGQCLGFVCLDGIKPILASPEMHSAIIVADVMTVGETQLQIGDSMEEVMRTFACSGLDEIPVFEGAKLRGFLSRSRVFDAYREMLVALQGR